VALQVGAVLNNKPRSAEILDPLDPWIYELCFPGAISGEAEVTCPHCGTMLTVSVDDPTASQTYNCCECNTVFKVNWGA